MSSFSDRGADELGHILHSGPGPGTARRVNREVKCLLELRLMDDQCRGKDRLL